MKKAISLILAAVMLCVSLPTSVFALNEYIVFEGMEGCQLINLTLTQADNPWLLWDVTFANNGQIFTSQQNGGKDHPGLVGCEAVLDLEYEGSSITFNGEVYTDGTAVTLEAKNELVVYADADKVAKAEYTVCVTEETNGLPVVLIDTDGADIPDKLNYVDASISVLGSDIYGAEDFYDAEAGIKLRGNSTMGYAKKPYRIKFEDKQNVLGLGKAKSWVLLADYLDPSSLRNQVAFNLAARINSFTRESNPVFAPRMKLVEVYLNGEFKGLYEMGDHMQANELRVAINELGDEKNAADYTGEQIGYFIEVEVESRVLVEGEEGYEDWSDYSFIKNVGASSQAQDDKLYFQFKLPEEPTDEHKVYITGYMQNVNDLILKHDDAVWNYVDMDSVINWYLVNELFKNADSQMQSSIYFYKDGTLDEDGNLKKNPDTKLYMAPVWDFDLGAGGVSYGEMNDPTEWRTRNDEYCGWFRELFEMDSFQAAVEKRWADLRDAGIFGQMFSDIDTIGAFAKEAAEANYELWHENYVDAINSSTWMTVPEVSTAGDWNAQLTYLSKWLHTRVTWMDGEFGYSEKVTNETVTLPDTAVLLDEEEVIATTAGTSIHSYPIDQLLPLDHLAMNVDADSSTNFDVQFNIRVATNLKNTNGEQIVFTLTPYFAGDWEPQFHGTDQGLNHIISDTYNDVRITFNGAIVWTLKHTPAYQQLINTSLSDAEILTTYVTAVRLNTITVKQFDATVGDTLTLTLQTYSQSKNTISDVNETIEKTVIGGAPIIAGEPTVGNTLTLTELGITPHGAAVRYQWYANDEAIQGETGTTYTVKESDFGKTLSVKSFGLFNYTGDVESEGVVVTGDGTVPVAPAAPTLSNKGTDNITINAVSGNEYTIDGETWYKIDENGTLTFNDLTAGACYTVYARVAATDRAPASEASKALYVTTNTKGAVRGDVNANGEIDTKDAVLVLDHALDFIDLKNPAVIELADHNGDDKVNTGDARSILKAIVNTPS